MTQLFDNVKYIICLTGGRNGCSLRGRDLQESSSLRRRGRQDHVRSAGERGRRQHTNETGSFNKYATYTYIVHNAQHENAQHKHANIAISHTQLRGAHNIGMRSIGMHTIYRSNSEQHRNAHRWTYTITQHWNIQP